MSERVALLASLAVTKEAHGRAVDRCFIGLMRAIDEDGASWDNVDLPLSKLKLAENKFDRKTGDWRIRCMFHDDDWHEAELSTLTVFLEDLAKDGGSGIVFAYGDYSPCALWHLRNGRAELRELDAAEVPAELRKLVNTEAWHLAADAALEWSIAESAPK